MKYILLQALYRILAFFSRRYLDKHQIIVVGVTGSVGKTSCRIIIKEVLEQLSIDSESDVRVYSSPKNFNSELGLVFSVFQIEEYEPGIKNILGLTCQIISKSLFGVKNTDILIAEYGIDTPGDMHKLLRICIPDIAVLTKLDAVHSGNFSGGVREYWAEKWKLLLRARSRAYVNLQDEYSVENYYLLPDYVEIGDQSEKNFELEFHSEDIVRMNFSYNGIALSTNLIGEDTMMYMRLGYDIANDLGFEIRKQEKHFHFDLQSGRFSFFKKGAHIFIDSSYNSSPESMKLALKHTFLLQKKIFSDYEIIVVSGDMRELGDLTEESHRCIAQSLMRVKRVYTVGPLSYEYLISELHLLGYTGKITSSLSAREIGKKLKKFLEKSSEEKYIILFKGSQNTIYTEEALAELLPKSEHKKLPRQEKYWKQKKEIFFNEV